VLTHRLLKQYKEIGDDEEGEIVDESNKLMSNFENEGQND
jgi:hypothetical protein